MMYQSREVTTLARVDSSHFLIWIFFTVYFNTDYDFVFRRNETVIVATWDYSLRSLYH